MTENKIATQLLAEVQEFEGIPPFGDVCVSNNTARDAVCEIDRLEAENAHLGALIDELRSDLKWLVFHARTSGGIAGADPGLMAACERAEKLLSSLDDEIGDGAEAETKR